MSDAIASEAPSPSATSSHGTTEPIAIVNGHKFFRVSDVCVALKTAHEVKGHLNAEVEKYVKETASKEQELDAWKQHCKVLARSLTAARRNSEAEKYPASIDEEDAELLAKEEKAAEAAAAAPSWTLGEAPAAFESVKRKAAISGWMISIAEVKLGSELGVGTFGTTHLAQWRGTTVAMKRIKPMENEVEAVNFLREVECLASVRHPHVLPFLGAVLQIPDSCWLLTEFMTGGTLATWLHGAKGRRLKPSRPLVQRLKRGLEVARGMQALHENQPAIVHRDLKPSNVFVASAGHAVVGDLGLARRLPSSGLDLHPDATATAASTLTGETGTYIYMSPEMMRHEDYSTATDVWSWAVMMVELITQRAPYEELFLTPIQVALGVSDYTIKPKIPGTLPDELCTLLNSCFDSDTEMRPPFSAIVPSLAAIVEAMERQAEAGGDNVLMRLFRQPGGLFQQPPASSDSASNPAAAAPVGEPDNDDVLPAPAMSMEEPGPATDMRGGQLQQLDQNREGLGLPRGGAREYPAVSRAAAFFQGAGMKLGQVLRHPASRPAS